MHGTEYCIEDSIISGCGNDLQKTPFFDPFLPFRPRLGPPALQGSCYNMSYWELPPTTLSEDLYRCFIDVRSGSRAWQGTWRSESATRTRDTSGWNAGVTTPLSPLEVNFFKRQEMISARNAYPSNSTPVLCSSTPVSIFTSEPR